MKNKMFFLSFLLLSLGFLTACSSDDDSPAEPVSGSIVGKWNYTHNGEILNGNENLDVWNHMCNSKMDNLEFHSNGEVDENNYDESCVLDSVSYNYQVVGDKIKLTSSELTVTFKIHTLTNTTLKLVLFAEGQSEDTGLIIVLNRA